MRRLARSFAPALFACFAALPAVADDATMTPEEREALHAEIRAYILEHPEILVEAMDVLQAREEKAAAERDLLMLSANEAEIFQNPNDWVGGNPEGDVVLVEFMDYRCGYCRKAYDEVNELVESDGNIKLVVKEFPILGEASLLSAQFAIAVKVLHGDAAYEAAHDALIALRGEPTQDTLARLAQDLGHEPQPILAKMGAPDVNDIIKSNHALADKMEITGTPTFVLKSMMLRGYLPLEAMREVVDEVRTNG